MANGFKTGGKDFQPGETGNPNGRPKLPDDIKALRKMNKIEVERILNEFVFMTPEELQAKMHDKSTPTMELAVGKILAEAIKKGDQVRLGWVLDRLIGPVKQKVSVDGGEDNSPIAVAVGKIDWEERAKQLKGEE